MFEDDETWLRRFTSEHSKDKSISEIGSRELKKWIKRTKGTDGQHLADSMDPSVWGDSVESLRTAIAIIELAPDGIRGHLDWEIVRTELRLAILRKMKKKVKFASSSKRK